MRIFWTCFENLFFWNNFYQFACFLLQHTSSDHLIPFECSWNCLSNNVPPSVQLAVDQLPTDEVPHWKAEIWTIVHQAVLGSQSEVLSKMSETDAHRTNVPLGTQTSYIWSYLLYDSVGIGYNRKVSCVKTFKWGPRKRMSPTCFCFRGFLIIWGNLFVPEVNPNFSWFFSLKELDHRPPQCPFAPSVFVRFYVCFRILVVLCRIQNAFKLHRIIEQPQGWVPNLEHYSRLPGYLTPEKSKRHCQSFLDFLTHDMSIFDQHHSRAALRAMAETIFIRPDNFSLIETIDSFTDVKWVLCRLKLNCFVTIDVTKCSR